MAAGKVPPSRLSVEVNMYSLLRSHFKPSFEDHFGNGEPSAAAAVCSQALEERSSLISSPFIYGV